MGDVSDKISTAAAGVDTAVQGAVTGAGADASSWLARNWLYVVGGLVMALLLVIVLAR